MHWATFLSQIIYDCLHTCSARRSDCKMCKLTEIAKMPKNARHVG